jgi:hypothetical protein
MFGHKHFVNLNRTMGEFWVEIERGVSLNHSEHSQSQICVISQF